MASRSNTPWLHLLILLGALLAAVGWWLPWILPARGAAALVLLGLDLGEFWKFTGEWRAGLFTVERLFFFLPPPLAAILLSLALTHWRGRWLLLPLLLFLSLVVLPAPDLLLPNLLWLPPRLATADLTREFGFQLYLSLVATGVVVLMPLWSRVPARGRGVLALAVATAGSLLPAWALWRTWPALQGLYGGEALPGPGVVIVILGFVLAGAGTSLLLLNPPWRSSAGREREAG